jgi:hypothetical protein
MSDAMSSIEIEDILSSIRRLVSEDLRPASRQAPAVLVDDKLILTPALRVVSGDEPASGPAETVEIVAPTMPGPLPRLHLGAEPAIEGRVASLEQAVEAQALDWESETGDPAPETVAFEWSSGAWAMHREEPAEAEVLSEAVAVGAEVGAGATPPWAQEDPGEVFTDLDLMLMEEAGNAATRAPEPEPELDPVWVDEAEAEVVAGLDRPEAAEGEAAVEAGTEMTFDEAVLRDLVRDLIREELQGGLGERITRNVRKLVRAEIARALATRDFD